MIATISLLRQELQPTIEYQLFAVIKLALKKLNPIIATVAISPNQL
jgi:hypothetical protein